MVEYLQKLLKNDKVLEKYVIYWMNKQLCKININIVI